VDYAGEPMKSNGNRGCQSYENDGRTNRQISGGHGNREIITNDRRIGSASSRIMVVMAIRVKWPSGRIKHFKVWGQVIGPS
jgi:hypothetical protein